MKLIAIHTVPKRSEPIRLSDYGKGIFAPIPSRKGFKKAIIKGYIKVNGIVGTTGLWVNTGDKIELFLPGDFKPVYEREMSVVFEDDHLAVVDKPAGLLVNGNSFQTVENALPYNLQSSPLKDALYTPEVAHRLDFGTSGLLLVAKTASANIGLKKLFEERQINKTYCAIIVGEFSNQTGMITKEVDEKEAITKYIVKQVKSSPKYHSFNLLELYPETGRRHQIRKHLASIGFPILGDRDYGNSAVWDMKKGLYLQASKLSFKHPLTDEKMQFELELPNKFKKLLRRNVKTQS